MSSIGIEDILKCPYCPEEDTLSFSEYEVTCSKCGNIYPVRDAIYVIYFSSKHDSKQSDADKWKEEERVHHDSIVDIYEETIVPKGVLSSSGVVTD